MRKPLAVALVALLSACSREAAPAATETESADAAAQDASETVTEPVAEDVTPVATEAPAGEYKLDKYHASLLFMVDHIGYSTYTGQFSDFDATLQFDPKAPETMQVEATIDVGSLQVPSPPDGFLDTLKGPQWLKAAAQPQMTFKSTKVTLTGPDTARIDGELSLAGVTAPVSMEATFNGGYAGFPPYDPAARIGFSAKGALSRSAFGASYGVPTEEAPVGVGDTVTFVIEAEFNGPPTPAEQ